jgi:hypothetical protein
MAQPTEKEIMNRAYELWEQNGNACACRKSKAGILVM